MPFEPNLSQSEYAKSRNDADDYGQNNYKCPFCGYESTVRTEYHDTCGCFALVHRESDECERCGAKWKTVKRVVRFDLIEPGSAERVDEWKPPRPWLKKYGEEYGYDLEAMESRELFEDPEETGGCFEHPVIIKDLQAHKPVFDDETRARLLELRKTREEGDGT